MRNLSDIIEDCKINGRPDYDELRYSLLVMTGVLNMVNSELAQIYVSGELPHPIKRQIALKGGGVCNMYHAALNKPPKEYLGWNHDPENPEYQRFHAMGNKLVEKALKGELPNQKNKPST